MTFVLVCLKSYKILGIRMTADSSGHNILQVYYCLVACLILSVLENITIAHFL
jgi:hypothetical protein